MAEINGMKLRPLWSKNYPEWRQTPASKETCLTISRIIRTEAARLISGNDWSAKVDVVLASYNIPKDQFVEFTNHTIEQSQPGTPRPFFRQNRLS